MNSKVKHVCAALWAALAVISCTQGYEYNSYVSLDERGWNKDSLAVFEAQIPDSVNTYDIWFMIRNENNYPYQNLWLFVEATSPSGQMVCDTVECTLARPDGTWVGGGWGSLYTARYAYRLQTRFAQAGNYSFRIAHGMRHDDVIGIKSIGLCIEESKSVREE